MSDVQYGFLLFMLFCIGWSTTSAIDKVIEAIRDNTNAIMATRR